MEIEKGDLTNSSMSRASSVEFLQVVLDLAPDPIIVTDRYTTEILFVNTAAKNLFGDDIKQRELKNDHRGNALEIVEHVKENGFLDSAELTWLTPSGRRILAGAGACLRQPVDGKFLCVYSIKDITRIKETEKCLRDAVESRDQLISELEQKSAELDRIIQSKQRLLSQLSHEVKNPLGIIMGFSDLLRSSESFQLLEPQLREGVEAISRNAEHILDVVNDQLALSKAQFSSPQIKIETIELNDLAHKISISIGLLASQKGLEFMVENHLQGLAIKADRKLLRQVILNLVSNAIKFTTKGFVKVSILRAGESNIAIEVEDSGCGISHKDQSKLFEPFFQAHEDAGVRSLGSGLGLNIVRGIANQLGGSIALIRSEMGVGSMFRFEIPQRFS